MEESQPPSILGDHELIRKISAGSYGEVWLARSELGAYRAVKIIHRTRFDSERPFRREYEGIQKFEPVSRSHEGLVDVLHVGRGPDADSFYYIMELADDLASGQRIAPQDYQPRTLASEVRNKGPLPTDQCIQIGIQLCRSLGFLHEHGLLHRDVKPSNIIFINSQPKLADIGLVAGIEDAKTLVGTVGFIPPEGPNSVQADIYSLGKLLYEISTGQDRHDFPALPPRSEFSPEFLEFNEVLVKACNTDVRRRYRTALAMASDLELIGGGKSVRRLHVLEARFDSFRKYGAVLLAALLVFGTVYYQANQSWHRAREQQATLIGSKIGRGTSLLQQGDLLGALPFFAEAAQLDQFNKSTRESHALRIGSILAASPSIKHVWRLPDQTIRSCAVCGRWAVATIARKYAQVFDLETGNALPSPLGAEMQPYTATFGSDGKTIITANYDETVRVINWETGQTILTLKHPATVFTANPNPGGRRLITGCKNGSVFLWDCETRARKQLGQHNGFVFCARFSPSGNLAVTTSADSTARVWDLRTGTERFRFEHSSWVYSADFSPDEHVLATASYDKEVRLWDLNSGKEIAPSLHHDGAVRSVQFSPDGQRILSACLDGTARLWETKTHRWVELNHTLRHKTQLLSACFADNGKQILTAGNDGTLTLWDFSRLPIRPKAMGKMAPAPSALRSSDGLWEAQTNGSHLTFHNLRRATMIGLDLHTNFGPVQFSSSAAYVSVADGTNVYLVDLNQGKTRTLNHPKPVTSFQFSPDSRTIVCASTDKTLDEMSAQLWNVSTGTRIGPPLQHEDGVLYAGFSPDNRLVVTASEDSSAIIWDAASGKQITPKLRHREKVYSAAFAKTKPWVATASEDFTAVIWDTRTGDPLTPPFEHSKAVVRAEFTDNDTALLTTDEDGDQWKWPLAIETRPSQEVARLVSLLTGVRKSGK